MPIAAKTENDLVTITLEKSFDFGAVADFRTAYSNTVGRRYIVDFRGTDYMDSSGLGMLLNMRRYLGDGKIPIELINCRPQIKRVLTISSLKPSLRLVDDHSAGTT